MKVRDLIKDTIWLPNEARSSSPPPIVSVLWPSYRQEGDRLFLEAARSILDQTLTNFELIIIDDGTSGDADRSISDLMAADARVNCLRHPRNIGLPAVSEFEAFTRANGRYFAFGFDDFVFDQTALSRLVDAAEGLPGSVVHGFVEWFDEQGRQYFYGKDAVPQEGLKFYNFLGNSSFLVPRSVLDEVGLYDPHIAATRLSDWDLWRRIHRKYPIARVPVLVGREYGNTRPASLGKSYPLIEEAMQEYFNTDRDALLRPQHFADRDVWRLPSKPSSSLTTHIFTLRNFFKRTRDWAGELSPEAGLPSVASPTRPIIGIFGSLNLITPMIFDALHIFDEYSISYLYPHRDDSYLQCCLAQCSILIMAADPFNARSEYALNVCSLLNVPVYYLPDHAVSFASDGIDEFYSHDKEAVRTLLGRLAGSLCGSELIAHRLRKNWPDQVVYEVPLAFEPNRKEKLGRVKSKTDAALHIGVLEEQYSDTAPLAVTLRRLNNHSSIQVHYSVASPSPSILGSVVEDTPSCDEFLINWRQHRTDVLIATAKTGALSRSAILLIACYLEAVPIFTETCCEFGPEQGALTADGTAESYERALVLVSDPETRRQLVEALNRYCASTLTPYLTHTTLTKLLQNCATASTASHTSRLRALLMATSSHAAIVSEAALTLAYSDASGHCAEPPSISAAASRGGGAPLRTQNVFDVTLDRGGHHVFGIPAGTSIVRLLSEPHMAPGDNRKLGAAIASISIDGSPISLSDLSLVRGFHQNEGKFRWTDGEGILPILVRSIGSVLELEVVWASKEMAQAYGEATPHPQPPPPPSIIRRLTNKIRRVLARQKRV
ncbi:MAG: glycosyltransferase [Alphaproteobacteria bacterium]